MTENSKSSLWGGRFKKPLHEKTIEFNASISFDYKLALYDIQGSKVHAQMLSRQKIISIEESQKIIEGLNKIEQKILHKTIEFFPEYEDIHMNIEMFLVNEIGDVAKKLHTARSRNDQVALDLRLYVKNEIKNINSFLSKLNFCIHNLENKYKNSILPGYTHLQKAQPVNLALHLNAYFCMFQRDITRLEDCNKRLQYCPLGAGALAGTTLPIDRQYVAKELGFLGVIENSIDAVSDRDFVVEFMSAASLIMVHLSRFCEDLILWATEEFNFIQLDDAFATGSSLMPNKKNPDIPELIRGKTGRVYGNLMTILTVMKALPLSYNKDMQEDKECLFDTVDTIKNCLEIFTLFLDSVEFKTENMKKSALNSYIWSTKILENLVKNNVAFRVAHELVGNLVIYCLENKKLFTDLKKEECDNISLFIYPAIMELEK